MKEVGTFGQAGYVAKSGPLNFERLYVDGVEVIPGGTGGAQIANVKPIALKDGLDAAAVARAFNGLIAELKAAGIMADK